MDFLLTRYPNHIQTKIDIININLPLVNHRYQKIFLGPNPWFFLLLLFLIYFNLNFSLRYFLSVNKQQKINFDRCEVVIISRIEESQLTLKYQISC